MLGLGTWFGPLNAMIWPRCLSNLAKSVDHYPKIVPMGIQLLSSKITQQQNFMLIFKPTIDQLASDPA